MSMKTGEVCCIFQECDRRSQNSKIVSFLSSQYNQSDDDHFTSAVVLSLILAVLFGFIYLLMIPQYVRASV